MPEYAFVTDPVVRAVCEEDVAKVRELAAGGASLDESDGTFGPPLVAALRDENREMLALLLELGADPNGPDLINWETPLTPLLCAAVHGRAKSIEAVHVLLEAGADPHAAKPPDPDRLEMNCQVAEELAGRGLKHTQGETDPEDEPQSVLELARRHNASLIYVESPSDARNITRLLLAPMTDWIALLRMCGTNGANHGLRTRDIVTWLAKTGEQHPFELQGCGHDFVAIRFTEPIDDYEALHAAMESFCPGLSGDDPVEPAELKEFYANDRRCFFWWD